MIQSMSMAFGFRVPVYPKISGTRTAKAVLNNLARNPYAAALYIDGEDGGTGAADIHTTCKIFPDTGR